MEELDVQEGRDILDERVLDFVEGVLNAVASGEFTHGSTERRIEMLDVVCRCFVYMVLLEGTIMSDDLNSLVDSLRQLIVNMELLLEAETVVSRGRPRVLENDQLVYVVENGFRVKDIAYIFHCSKCTIGPGTLEIELGSAPEEYDDEREERKSMALSTLLGDNLGFILVAEDPH